MPQQQKPNKPNFSVEHSGKLLETDDDIRHALLVEIKGSEHNVAARPAVPDRPTSRPPTAILTVCDDGPPSVQHGNDDRAATEVLSSLLEIKN